MWHTNMKAKELIEILQKDPEAEVVITTSNFEQGHAKVALGHVSKWKMKKIRRQFRDAFDGGSYSDEVYEMSPNDGEEVFVL